MGVDNLDDLTKTVIALTNLYGVVDRDKVRAIYNQLNSSQLSKHDMNDYYQDPPDELEDYFVYTERGYFLHEAVYEFDELDLELSKKKNKSYYVPPKDELLKYVEDEYFDQTEQYEAFQRYAAAHFFNGDIEKAEELSNEIQGVCQFDFDMQEIFRTLDYYKISFQSKQQVNEVIKLVTDMANHTRIWMNNGYTPHEILERDERPSMLPLPDQTFDLNNTGSKTSDNKIIDFKTRIKVGRNDPCPCGSGKIYKKCCLHKNESSSK